MRKSIIIAGAAALLAAGPALAQGKGQGGGPKGGGGGPAKAERGGGGGSQAHRGGGSQRAERKQMRGPERQQAGRAEHRKVRGPDREKGRDVERRDVRAAQASGRQEQRGSSRHKEVRKDRDVRHSGEARMRGDRDRTRVQTRDARQEAMDRRSSDLRVAGGSSFMDCPPGLAAKNNGCLPPGQARKLVGVAVPAALGSAMLPPLLREWYPDNDDYYFRAADGYVYRIDRDRNIVDGYFPAYDDWTGDYYVGAEYPDYYLGTYNVPVQYRPWYADSGEDYYRYGDGAIYRVDRQGGLIEAIVSLLAGDLAVGQQLPSGYDVYNVPYDYRDRYADTQDAWYRYNDGRIYEVDPTTRLVQAIVETLV